MHRHVPLLELPAFVANLGYEYIELSPRADFLDWWVNPAPIRNARGPSSGLCRMPA